MTLEHLVNTLNNAMHHPLGLFLDVGGHFLSGYTLSQVFFPEIQKSKKIVISLTGLLPDIDFLIGIKHRTLTHTLGFLIWSSANVFAGNREDLEKRKNFFGKLITSRYLWFTSMAIGSHLLLDKCKTNEERALYFLGISAILSGTILYNKVKNRYQKKEKCRYKGAIVIDDENGSRYFVSESYQFKMVPEHYAKSWDNFPYVVNIPGYSKKYGTLESWEIVKGAIINKYLPKPSIWDNLDDIINKLYGNKLDKFIDRVSKKITSSLNKKYISLNKILRGARR